MTYQYSRSKPCVCVLTRLESYLSALRCCIMIMRYINSRHFTLLYFTLSCPEQLCYIKSPWCHQSNFLLFLVSSSHDCEGLQYTGCPPSQHRQRITHTSEQNNSKQLPLIDWLIYWVQGLTPHWTHYRSYRERVFTDQMTEPTVSKYWRKMFKD